jgi:hypothetical protein
MNSFTIYDELTGEHFNLFNYIEALEERVKKLEEENVGTTNALYELENKLDQVISYIPDNYDLTL